MTTCLTSPTWLSDSRPKLSPLMAQTEQAHPGSLVTASAPSLGRSHLEDDQPCKLEGSGCGLKLLSDLAWGQ